MPLLSAVELAILKADGLGPSAFNIAVSSVFVSVLEEREGVSQSCRDCVVCRTSVVVGLGVAEYIAQAIIVTPLKDEVSYSGLSRCQAGSPNIAG